MTTEAQPIPEDAASDRRQAADARRWTDPEGRVDLLSLDREGLDAYFRELNEKPFRAQQLFRWLHMRGAASFEEMTDLSKALRAKLQDVAAITRPVIEDVKVSSDGTRKYQLRTHDGHVIESVYIPDASGPGRNALCISSQVGCAMACRFCATAALKLKRHLNPGEIVGQLYAVNAELREAGVAPAPSGKGREARAVTNLIYMGMGEPLHNYAGVVGSIRLLTAEDGQGYSPRRLTVSTSGLVPAIERLGEDTDVHIAISLNATTDEVRDEIMPVNRRWKIDALLGACREFPLRHRQRLTFEYVMLAGLNDTDDDARRLVRMLKDMKPKVNLIPFNPHPLSDYQRPDDERVAAFQQILSDGHLSCFVRTTRGLDIDAACGMLGAKKLEEVRGALPVLG
jgi:23S rRNA (adenine2503-C2)-methyltransferase